MNSMSGKCFVDTNILVYAHDLDAGAKHQRATEVLDELWGSGNGVISTQVLQELCLTVRRKYRRPFSIAETQTLIEAYTNWEVVINDKKSVLDALAFEQRYKVSFWDALILQAAESAEVDTLLSEDLAAGQRYGGFRVENPFAGLPKH
jgi:predicted nucleic acid-binding protein